LEGDAEDVAREFLGRHEANVVRAEECGETILLPVAVRCGGRVASPIAEDAVIYGAHIELGAESVEHHSTIDARGGEGILVNLERTGALRRLHRGVDDGIER
jgi:hypothetical protein